MMDVFARHIQYRQNIGMPHVEFRPTVPNPPTLIVEF